MMDKVKSLVETTSQLVILGCVESVPEHGEDERYTTRETLEWCKARASVDAFDLDVAACEEAHCAPAWFDKKTNGLKQSWVGRVWCKPPYSNIEPWIAMAQEEHWRGNCALVAMLLPATRTEQPWWQKYIEPVRDLPHTTLRTHFLPGRTRYGFPGNKDGIGVGSPNFTSVLLVWRRP